MCLSLPPGVGPTDLQTYHGDSLLIQIKANQKEDLKPVRRADRRDQIQIPEPRTVQRLDGYFSFPSTKAERNQPGDCSVLLIYQSALPVSSLREPWASIITHFHKQSKSPKLSSLVVNWDKTQPMMETCPEFLGIYQKYTSNLILNITFHLSLQLGHIYTHPAEFNLLQSSLITKKHNTGALLPKTLTLSLLLD